MDKNMTKFSKEPWLLQESSKEYCELSSYEITSDGMIIAAIINDALADYAEGNAQLMSASPKMFEALRNLLEFSKHTLAPKMDDPTRFDDFKAVKDAVAALNKARPNSEERAEGKEK